MKNALSERESKKTKSFEVLTVFVYETFVYFNNDGKRKFCLGDEWRW